MVNESVSRVEIELSLVWGAEYPNLMSREMQKFHLDYKNDLWIKKIRLDTKRKMVTLIAVKRIH